MSVFVVRAFLKMRAFLGDKRELAKQLAALEKELKQRLDIHEAAIVTILQRVMDIIDPPSPPLAPDKPKIGFQTMSARDQKQQRSNAIRLRRIAWPRKRSGFIHHLAPHGMAGFVLVRFWFLVKSKAARVIKSSDKATSDSFRERRRETLFIDARKMGKLIDRVHRDLTTFRKCVVARFKAAASRLNVRLFGGEAGPALVTS